jgi:hypothetical protein
MKSMLRGVLAAAAFVLCAAAGLTAAKADVIRVALVVADKQADYDSNVALAPTFDALLKKAAGVKTAYVGTDAGKLTIMSSSVWPDEAAIKALTDSADWKAAAGKLKYKTYTVEIFQIP